jgi:mono/diheme cytochrome c family protein
MNMSLNFRALSGLPLLVFVALDCPQHVTAQDPVRITAAAPCKTGFKRGKTPVSLVVGTKPGCYDTKLAATGKRLLTGMSNSCFACHTPGGINPFTQMNSNLRTQGYTLAPARISEAFTAHQAEMAGASITSKDAKAISHFLQSIR